MFELAIKRSRSIQVHHLNNCGSTIWSTGLCSAFGSMSDSRARGPRLVTWSGHIHSFLLPLIPVGQLSVTGESMYTKYWLPA